MKNTKNERKKASEEAKQEFQKLKSPIDSTTGETQGDQAKNQGKVGLEAWTKAKEFGLNVSYSSDNGANSNDLANKVIDDALKKIEEGAQNSEKKK
nr:hypothetical protein [Borreliella bissettiae]